LTDHRPRCNIVERIDERSMRPGSVGGRGRCDIAGELVVSVRTAEGHVGIVLQKLGVTSRAQAMARLAELQLVPGRGRPRDA
jgi:hypothetical protein